MKIDRGLLGTLAAAALTAACASAGAGGAASGPRVTVSLPDVTCAPGTLVNNPYADSAAASLALVSQSAGDSANAAAYVLARRTAGRSITSDPTNAYGYLLAGNAAVRSGDYADADSLLRRTLELCPALGPSEVDQLRRGAGSLAFQRAHGLLQAGDTTGAVAGYQTALGLDPQNYPAEFYLGLVAFGRQQTDEAVRRWRRIDEIVAQMPADSSAEEMADRASARANALNALTFAARQYLERQQTEQGLALLTDLRQRLPNNPDVAYTYALALNTMQRWNELLPAAQRAVELAPLSYPALVLYYNGYAGQSQLAEAANNRTQSQELARQAAAIRERHDNLPVQIENVQVDVGASGTTVRGQAAGTGQTAPVTLEFTLHGASGPVGTGTVTVTPPAENQRSPFELTIANTADVTGVSYRVVGG